MKQYLEYYKSKRKRSNHESTRQALLLADATFSRSANLAETHIATVQRTHGSALDAELRKIMNDMKLIEARSWSCKLVTADALGAFRDAVAFGERALPLFREVGDVVREYQTMYNMFLPTLRLYTDLKSSRDLDRCIHFVDRLILLSEGHPNLITKEQHESVKSRRTNLLLVREGRYSVRWIDDR